MEKNTYDTIPDFYAVNAVSLADDVIDALTESSHVLNLEPKLILSFVVDYLNTHIENL